MWACFYFLVIAQTCAILSPADVGVLLHQLMQFLAGLLQAAHVGVLVERVTMSPFPT
jgi:hypothetical protein